jgi:hypothetical protein
MRATWSCQERDQWHSSTAICGVRSVGKQWRGHEAGSPKSRDSFGVIYRTLGHIYNRQPVMSALFNANATK